MMPSSKQIGCHQDGRRRPLLSADACFATVQQQQCLPHVAEKNSIVVDRAKRPVLPKKGRVEKTTRSSFWAQQVVAMLAIAACFGMFNLTRLRNGFAISASSHEYSAFSSLDQYDNDEWKIGPTYRFLRKSSTIKFRARNKPACSLTAVFMDAKLPTLPTKDIAYTKALESVAQHGPKGLCVVLQTSGSSILDLHRTNEHAAWDKGPSNANAQYKLVGDKVYKNAGSEFRSMIDAGRVRLTILNHTKYGLNRHNYSTRDIQQNPNRRYLMDEFVSGVDNDMMLFVQRDTFLCQPVTIKQLWNSAHVGSSTLVNRLQMIDEMKWIFYMGAPKFGVNAFPKSESRPRLYPPNIADDTSEAFDGCGSTANTKRTAEVALPESVQVINATIESPTSSSPRCKAYSEWHKRSYPTCNTAHELNFASSFVGADDTQNSMSNHKLQTKYLAQGHSRESWMFRRNISFYDDVGGGGRGQDQAKASKGSLSKDPSLVLKTLLWKRNYTEQSYEYQRIDAVASEVLTSSPNINDIYGFCGVTVLNDLGDGGTLKNYIWDNSETVTSKQRLIFARDAALGLADIHDAGGDHITTMVSHDIKLSNMIIVNGKLKIHDFNNAHLLKWDFEKKQRCGFHFHSVCIEFENEIERPSECLTEDNNFSEKIEVYRLGLILYFLLTEHQAGQVPPEHLLAINGTAVLSNPPLLPAAVTESDDLTVRAIRLAMTAALTVDESKRPSARKIANMLDLACKRMAI